MPTEFTHVRRVSFVETDMAGVVHFSNYFRMMEEVEHAFYRSLGLSVSMTHEAMEIGWPRVACACEFFGPLRFEDEVRLVLRVTKVGEKSFNYEVEFFRADLRVARGRLTSVCVALTEAGFQPIPIPAAIRAKLSAEP